MILQQVQDERKDNKAQWIPGKIMQNDYKALIQIITHYFVREYGLRFWFIVARFISLSTNALRQKFKLR